MFIELNVRSILPNSKWSVYTDYEYCLLGGILSAKVTKTKLYDLTPLVINPPHDNSIHFQNHKFYSQSTKEMVPKNGNFSLFVD